jgi:hypothetical protein
MRKKTVIAFIILIFALLVLSASAKAGFGATGEWIEVNLLTISTKAKQEKYLEYANRRVAEISVLANKEASEKNLRTVLNGYRNAIFKACDMAEKIIFLDGAEIGLAEDVENATRLHEQVLSELLAKAPAKIRPVLSGALSISRIENEEIFTYMVEKYQITDQDVEKHQKIVDRHLEIVERAHADYQKLLEGKTDQEIKKLLAEVQKSQKAGLALPAYQKLQAAKNLIYAKLAAGGVL